MSLCWRVRFITVSRQASSCPLGLGSFTGATGSPAEALSVCHWVLPSTLSRWTVALPPPAEHELLASLGTLPPSDARPMAVGLAASDHQESNLERGARPRPRPSRSNPLVCALPGEHMTGPSPLSPSQESNLHRYSRTRSRTAIAEPRGIEPRLAVLETAVQTIWRPLGAVRPGERPDSPRWGVTPMRVRSPVYGAHSVVEGHLCPLRRGGRATAPRGGEQG